MLADYFAKKETEIIEKIRQFVEIESPSFDVEGSRQAVSWLAETYPHFSGERIFAEDCGEHLTVRAFSSEKKPIMLLGHTDTVHPRGAKAQNPTRIDGDQFYGCGVFDMKANIVVMFEVLTAISELKLSPLRPINVVLSCDEEVGSHSGREIVEREAEKSEFCLVFEPSAGGKCKTGRKGTGNFTLKARGLPAHAGLEPEKGASAILELSRQIIEIHKLNNPAEGTTANVCVVSGGTVSNVIPEHASCEIDVRFTKMSEAERIKNELKSLKTFDERVKIELLGEINRPPLERTAEVVKLFEKARKVAQTIGYDLGETEVGGASDGNFVGALGVPVLDGLGISGNNAHRLDEFIYVSDIGKRAELLTKLLLEL